MRWTRNANIERNHYAKDLLQPLNRNGTISRDFVQAHGTGSLQKEWGMSDKNIRENAR